MTIIGVDPGPVQSAFVIWDGNDEHAWDFGIEENSKLLDRLSKVPIVAKEMVIEELACYGMPVGKSVLKTAIWSGRFMQQWLREVKKEAHELLRKDVKMHLCGSMRAKDGNIIQALKDRFEPDLLPRQRPRGILKGITLDMWQALAVAVTFYDQNLTKKIMAEILPEEVE